jgi:hypothetical protein
MRGQGKVVVRSTMTLKPPSQIFIVGMNGSGTTMLLDHLASHSLIFGYATETKSLPYFITHEARFGNLNDDQNYLRLWKEMKNSIVERAGLLRHDIKVPRGGIRSAASTFNHIMCQLASAEGKQVWCEKTPMYVHHLSLLADRFPDAKFIHIIRDGRDCAASFHRRWGFSPLRTIYRWRRAVTEGQKQGRRLGARYLEIRYEEITSAPETVFRRLFGFLEMPFETSVLVSGRSRLGAVESSEGAVAKNPRQAQSYFNARTVKAMESCGGRLLAELGYPCENQDGDRDPGRWRLHWWQFTDDFRRVWTLLLRKGRILKPAKWRYLFARFRNALKQKATL